MADGKKTAISREPCFALIGDMVGSRSITRGERPRAQAQFSTFVDLLNERYKGAMLSRFAITLGDEFQGVVGDASAIPGMIWDVETEFRARVLRLGFGYGTIDTAMPKFAINLDGPALHEARAAIEEAKAKKKLGGVFRGEGIPAAELNGFARLLWFHRARRTEQQLKVLGMLRQGMPQVKIAERLRQTPQAVYDHVKSAGWEAYREGEAGFAAVLLAIGKGA